MHNISIDLVVAKDDMVDSVYLRRGEGGLAAIVATIWDNGQPYDLTGCAVKFLAYDAKRRNIFESATITTAKSGVVSYTVSRKLTSIEGSISLAYFEITKGDGVITTQRIPIRILENVDLSGEESSEYESDFEKLLQSVNDMLAKANSALETAETISKDASQALSDANTALSNAQKAQSTATANESARETAEQQRKTAESGRVAAENVRDTAEQQRQNNEIKRQETWDSLVDDVKAATDDANEAADRANEAAGRVDSTISASEAATDAANKAANRVDESIRLATDAAGDATIAASVANATNERANKAISDMNGLMDTFVTIIGSEIRYGYSNSSTVPPTTWTAVPQVNTENLAFQWTRTIEYLSNGESETHYSVAAQGKDGRDGIGAQTSGLFWLWVDENGDLYATYSDEANPPRFNYDHDSGNLYATI